jgi:predicted DNA-binding antitoxin AbrB/MazE fold protein
MDQEFQAIFENGILRPLTPLNLPEAVQVSVRVHADAHSALDASKPSAAELQCQQAALDAMFQAVDQMPQTKHSDGLSGRDHDKILYGSPK